MPNVDAEQNIDYYSIYESLCFSFFAFSFFPGVQGGFFAGDHIFLPTGEE